MAGSYNNYNYKSDLNKYLENSHKITLLKEIIVLVLIAALVAIFILFFSPALSKNIFFIKFLENNKNLSGNFEIKNIDVNNTDYTKNAAINNSYKIINTTENKNFIEIFFKYPNDLNICKAGNYFKFNLRAKNNSSTDFPAGSINIKWKYENENSYNPLNQESMQVYIDGLYHNYYDAVGENKNWQPGKKISSILIELPDVSGVNININEISFNKRAVFPLDSYINRFFKNNFNFIKTNRFLIPSYAAFLFILIIVYSLKLVSRKVTTIKIIFGAAVIILFIFSMYFFKNEILNVKSYYDSYKKNIISGNLKDTYPGFYDFEKFLRWADGKIPKDKNVIVLIRGEQIYIESEMAYNLYPRDVKFVNISKSSQNDIFSEISDINSNSSSNTNNTKSKTDTNNHYEYVIALSEDDIKDANTIIDNSTENKGRNLSDILNPKYNYKPDAGLIFTLK